MYESLVHYKRTNGFTLVEVTVVMAIVVTLVVFTLGSSGGYAKRQQYKTESNEVSRIVVEQKTKAVSSLQDRQHGFHIASSSITAFSGGQYNPLSADNKVTDLLYSIATTSLSYLGVPTTTIYFDKRTGQPSATGTIELYATNTNVATTTIRIYESGLVEHS